MMSLGSAFDHGEKTVTFSFLGSTKQLTLKGICLEKGS